MKRESFRKGMKDGVQYFASGMAGMAGSDLPDQLRTSAGNIIFAGGSRRWQ